MTPAEAIAARRLALAAALHDMPKLRAVLSYAEILAAVDVAMKTAGVSELVNAVVAAAAVTAAVQADVPTPPSSVTDAIDVYTPSAGAVNEVFGGVLPL